jgi:hypothetical protein
MSWSSFSLIRRCAGMLLFWATPLRTKTTGSPASFSRTSRGVIRLHATHIRTSVSGSDLLRAQLAKGARHFPEPKESFLCEIAAFVHRYQTLLITSFSQLDTRSPCVSQSTFCYCFRQLPLCSLDLYKYREPIIRRPPIYLESKTIAVSVWQHLLQQRAPAVF